ncbi:hypothetical protein FOA52_001807 [Chlamydomonas sp. UWO 241]|nr:hypothetical protein FOA52_001807 [Chlamydomonas sp. UWO 241]
MPLRPVNVDLQAQGLGSQAGAHAHGHGHQRMARGAALDLQAWFPALQHLDLSSQDLTTDLTTEPAPSGHPHPAAAAATGQPVSDIARALAGATTLRSLDLSRCKVPLEAVAFILHGLHGLRHLCLAELILPSDTGHAAGTPAARESQDLLLRALPALPWLSGLDVARELVPGRPSHGLSLARGCSALAPLTWLTALNLHGQQLDAGDIAAVGSLTA